MSEKTVKELIKEKRREYAREWRKKNPDKAKQNNIAYWERKVLKELAGASSHENK